MKLETFFLTISLFLLPLFTQATPVEIEELKTKSRRIGFRLTECFSHANQNLPIEKRVLLSDLNAPVFNFKNYRKYNWDVLIHQYKDLKITVDQKVWEILEGSDVTLCNRDILLSQLPGLKRLETFSDLVARMISMEPRREVYAKAVVFDLRGFLNLKERAENDQKSMEIPLKNADIDTKKHLMGMCKNAGLENCSHYLKQSEFNLQTVWSVYQTFRIQSQDLYRSYFSIYDESRLKKFWTSSNPSIYSLTVAFNLTELPEKLKETFIQGIQEYWFTSVFKLFIHQSHEPSLPFVKVSNEELSYVTVAEESDKEQIPYINLSYRDNTPGSQSTKFVAAHEFGHILGFPDCYVEFYDVQEKAFISYALDPENVMCSLNGKVLPIHVQELRRVYRF